MKPLQIEEFLGWIPWKKYSEAEMEYLTEKLSTNALTLDGCKAAVLAYLDSEGTKRYLPAKALVAICWEQVKGQKRENDNGEYKDGYWDQPEKYIKTDDDFRMGYINAVAHDDGRIYKLLTRACSSRRPTRWAFIVERENGERINLWADEFDGNSKWQGVFDERFSEPIDILDISEAQKQRLQAERAKRSNRVLATKEECPW